MDTFALVLPMKSQQVFDIVICVQNISDRLLGQVASLETVNIAERCRAGGTLTRL